MNKQKLGFSILYVGFFSFMAGFINVASAQDFSESFASPATVYQPRFRWWWPGASVNSEELIREVNEIADAGFGGFEIADVYDSVAAPMDPAEFGWGTERWNAAIETVLESALDRGLAVDLTIGPHWPSTVPTIVPDDVAAAKEVIHGKAVIPAGESFNGSLPEPVLAASGISGGNPNPPVTTYLEFVLAARCQNTCEEEGTITLDADSVVNLTNQASGRQINWTAPADGEWVLIPIYTRATGQIVNMFDGNPNNSPVTEPQSYVVDPFGEAGSRAVIDYWESTLLTPRIRELLREVGGSVFEDSIELKHTQYWTEGILDAFQSRRGYSVVPYLPVLMNLSRETFNTVAQPAFYFTDTRLDEQVNSDWEQTINELWFENRLIPLQEWADSLGVQYRNQGYGTSVDVILSAALTGQPEGESLGFGANVDHYRALASGRDIAGGDKLSDEMGAFFGAYDTSWSTEMLPTMNRDFAGGVNELYLHGYAYLDAPETPWPGFAPFGTGFAEPWNAQQPTWQHIRDISGYMARAQFVLQQGVNRVDVAFLRQELDRHGGYPESQALLNNGFTVGYQSPATLALPSAIVEDGRLAAEGPAYKALIVLNERVMSIDTANRLLAFSRAGLPIVLAGELPSEASSLPDNKEQTARLQAIIAELLAERSVVQADTESALPELLEEIGIAPAARYAETTGLLNVRRHANGTDYYYFYNNSTETLVSSVDISGVGRPYQLDPWTGNIEPVAVFTANEGGVNVALSLLPGEAKIYALSDAMTAPAQSLLSTTADSAIYRNGSLVLQASQPGTYSSRLANGQLVGTEIPSLPSPLVLDDWQLQVESWEAGNSSTAITKSVLAPLQLEQLQSTRDIDGLEGVSGMLTYTTSITLGSEWRDGVGANLALGLTLDTVRVRINGQSVGPVNQINPVVDAGPYLREGLNEIEVEVATSLLNRLLGMEDERIMSGGFLGLGAPDPAAYGLLGPVVLQPYAEQAL